MWKIETLSSVSEYKPGAKVAHSPATALPTPDASSTPDPAEAVRAAEARAVDLQKLEQALGNVTAHIQNLHRSLQFSVDQESGETIVKVVDSETHEIIRQIPSEEILAIADRLRSSAGLLLTEHV